MHSSTRLPAACYAHVAPWQMGCGGSKPAEDVKVVKSSQQTLQDAADQAQIARKSSRGSLPGSQGNAAVMEKYNSESTTRRSSRGSLPGGARANQYKVDEGDQPRRTKRTSIGS